eukprot:8848540-Lingulodinium_polyedra.AAC.1
MDLPTWKMKTGRLQSRGPRRPGRSHCEVLKPPNRLTPQPRIAVRRLRGLHARLPEPLFVGDATAAPC